jgi:hypothetical protein
MTTVFLCHLHCFERLWSNPRYLYPVSPMYKQSSYCSPLQFSPGFFIWFSHVHLFCMLGYLNCCVKPHCWRLVPSWMIFPCWLWRITVQLCISRCSLQMLPAVVLVVRICKLPFILFVILIRILTKSYHYYKDGQTCDLTIMFSLIQKKHIFQH